MTETLGKLGEILINLITRSQTGAAALDDFLYYSSIILTIGFAVGILFKTAQRGNAKPCGEAVSGQGGLHDHAGGEKGLMIL